MQKMSCLELRVSVKRIYDNREEASEKAKKNSLYIYNNIEELLEDKEVDLVTIVTPNDNIINVMDGKGELIVKPEQTLRVMKVIVKVFKSHELGSGIRCNI